MLRDVAGGNGELDALNMCFDKDPECETMAESWYTIYIALWLARTDDDVFLSPT